MLTIGFANHYYTLWSVSSRMEYAADGRSYMITHYWYLKNLSTDFDQAKAKMDARGEHKKYAIDLDLRGDNGTRYFTKTMVKDFDLWQFSFGRLSGADMRISSDVWQLGRAMNQESNPRRRVYARTRLLELGEMIRYNWSEVVTRYNAPDEFEEVIKLADAAGTTPDLYLRSVAYYVTIKHKYCTKKQLEYIQKKEADAAISGHFFANGARLELNVKKHSSFNFDTAYGTTFIVNMLTEDGKLVKYKGSSPPYFENPDEFITVTASIEHGEYKGVKETRLKRIKVKKQIKTDS